MAVEQKSPKKPKKSYVPEKPHTTKKPHKHHNPGLGYGVGNFLGMGGLSGASNNVGRPSNNGFFGSFGSGPLFPGGGGSFFSGGPIGVISNILTTLFMPNRARDMSLVDHDFDF